MNNSDRIWSAMQHSNIDTVAYLPCNKLNVLMANKPDDMDIWDITKESAGLGLCFGRSLAGKRSAMAIQNTGLGNLITELYTLQKLYEVALPIFVSWRGHYKEPIEAQIIFGEKVETLLDAIDVEYKIIATADDLVGLNEDVAACFTENKVKVYLLSPEIWEENKPDYHVFGQPAIQAVQTDVPGYSGSPTVTRYGAIGQIMAAVDDNDIVLSQIGFPSKEVYNTKDRPTNFYMLGALGAATEVGIGLAKSIEERHVYVIDGDGSFFFNPNQLVDLAWYKPSNLTIICLDNGSWGSTGNQPAPSSQGYNLSAIVKSLGIDSVAMSDQESELHAAMKDKVSFVHYMINAGNDKVGGEIPLKALEIKQRFMQAVE
ncbi:thiamine pyrophosphate-dependent enzyme [Leucothrix pacifica]|uniref:Sulfopyruvate decarboxylase n=1 Tax=Leucothrix pacifica TaxID=1247513 RepID=A0A317C3N5_9GAMM|nr:thiamine pyrophosphate-dependent enzyme [Leucothrix pacifica]PWQ92889.1 sulfopyruvate decarboxylase [Leucothrix pacifica]